MTEEIYSTTIYYNWYSIATPKRYKQVGNLEHIGKTESLTSCKHFSIFVGGVVVNGHIQLVSNSEMGRSGQIFSEHGIQIHPREDHHCWLSCPMNMSPQVIRMKRAAIQVCSFTLTLLVRVSNIFRTRKATRILWPAISWQWRRTCYNCSITNIEW